MSLNKLKLISEKTELLVIGSQIYLPLSFPLLQRLMGLLLLYSPRSLSGVIFDTCNKLNIERQVAAICKSAFFQIRNISRIRKFLSVAPKR